MQLEVSLSRAHKLVERIKTLANQEFENISVQTSVSNTFVSLESLKAKSEQSQKALDTFNLLMNAQFSLKAQIAQYNAQRGVDTLLIKADCANKKLTKYKELVAKQDESACELDQYETHISSLKENKKDYFSLSVSTLNKASRDVIDEQIKNLQKEVFEINDEISDKNATKAQFIVDDSVVKLIT